MKLIYFCLILTSTATFCFGQDVRITNIPSPAANVTKIIPDPIDKELIYAVIGERVYRSENGDR